MKNAGKQGGYSLLELLFVLAIAGAAVGSSIPFLIQYAEKSRFESAAQKVATQFRQTKMLAVTRHEPHAVCVPLGEANKGSEWRIFTIKGGGKCDSAGSAAVENVVPYKVFQKSGKTEIKKITFNPRGTSSNKSFCIESKNLDRWAKITVSNFARITLIFGAENLCD